LLQGGWIRARPSGSGQGIEAAEPLGEVLKPGTLLGWAGWDHREQAHALVTLIIERTTRDGWDVERLKPLLAGLCEVMPWIRQWHGEVDPAVGISPADAYDGFFRQEPERHGLTEEEVCAWRPPKGGRGRRKVDDS
jgi:hypothetical protein